MSTTSRIRPLDIGLESVSRWRPQDEFHLPDERGLRPAYLPVYRPLDEILHRPSLDERLPQLLQPKLVDPDILEPALLSQLRIDTQRVFAARARHEIGTRRKALETAASQLDEAVNMDDEIRRALATLLKG